jgi:hypothetical protein
MTDLDRLIAAVEAGADWVSVFAANALPPQQAVDACRAYGYEGQPGTNGSLDAALRLHRDLFADWVAVIHTDGGVVLSDANMDRNHSASCNDNPARAWLLAVLRALRAREAA